MRETLRVYAIDTAGKWSKVAGYDRKTALKIINDVTIKNICHAVELVAVDSKCNIIARTGEKPTEPTPLRVCPRCLSAIESHEGKQITREIYVDEDDATPCDWCNESDSDILYEIL